ncbi:N-acetyl sugar amidotransferase [Candidatus Nitrosotenuis chungbukensis]|uniref:N-acetyl sugar amidotransferase n=1 Tax=Candidatus Nitrosotenuis chungbukensis TaxID=1353246 RepID=UPI0005B254C0|nr:N-acetyl sugar amidotransferase [Candidatus Nitrosotenuis chungbukensis]
MELRYCTKCLYPDTKPGLRFNEKGICDACVWAEKKDKIDWNLRKKEFEKLIEQYRCLDGSRYDCIVPVSGGKDSHFQVHVMKDLYGMNPLCVNFVPIDLIPLGRKNIENLKNQGVDYIEFTPNPKVYRKMEKYGLTELGDANWPEHVGIFTVPVQVAVAYKIPLIVWGENPQAEYGGSGVTEVLDRKWLEQFGGFWLDKVNPVSIMMNLGVEKRHLKPYVYPSDEEIRQIGIKGIFLGQYFKYDIEKQLETVEKLGFSRNPELKEGTYTNWENLDTKYTGMHDYFKWVKYGFGRATDHASLDIRSGKINREEGLKLVKQYEGKIPEKYFEDFLNDMEITRDEFYAIVDKFTNKALFKKDKLGNLLRDNDGNLEKIQYDNL